MAVGSRWIAHEKFGPRSSTRPRRCRRSGLERVSFPPMRESNRGEGGRVVWGYELSPAADGTRLEHYMTVLEPRKGAASLKAMYKVFGLPCQAARGGRTTLENIRRVAEQQA